MMMDDHAELNDSWEILSSSSQISSCNSNHSFEQVDYPAPLSFKDALLSSVAKTGGFRLDVNKNKQRSTKPRIIALSPSSAVRQQVEAKSVESTDDR